MSSVSEEDGEISGKSFSAIFQTTIIKPLTFFYIARAMQL